MRMKAGAITAAAAVVACVTRLHVDAASALPAPLVNDAQTSLATLAVSHDDPDRTWHQYESLVMSPSRSVPLVLFFEGDSAIECAAIRNHNRSDSDVDGIDDDDSDDDESEPSAETVACVAQHAERSELLQTALGAVARMYAASGLLVVRVPELLQPQLTRYHRVTLQPSLLWLAPRSAKNFQRFPHPEVNALDLSAPEALQLTPPTSAHQHQPPAPAATTTTDPSEQLTAAVSAFVRQWFVQSGLSPTATTAAPPQPPVSTSESAIEYVPALALLAFVGAVAVDNRALLQRTLAGRFVWFVWSAGVMYVAYSGVFHAVIHNAPLFYFSPNAGLYLFHPSGRRQFVLEGLLSGAWSFCVSLGAFSIVEILPMQHAALARTDVFAFSALVMLLSCAAVHVTFMAKTPWLA